MLYLGQVITAPAVPRLAEIDLLVVELAQADWQTGYLIAKAEALNLPVIGLSKERTMFPRLARATALYYNTVEELLPQLWQEVYAISVQVTTNRIQQALTEHPPYRGGNHRPRPIVDAKPVSDYQPSRWPPPPTNTNWPEPSDLR